MPLRLAFRRDVAPRRRRLESGVDDGEPEGVAGRTEAVDEADLDAGAAAGAVVDADLQAVERPGIVEQSELDARGVGGFVPDGDLDAAQDVGLRSEERGLPRLG